MDKTKIEVIDKLPPPTSVKGIKSFLRHTRFHRRLIKDFSKIANFVYMLLEHGRPLNFDENCLKVFVELKKALITLPFVVASDWSMPFELMCDASDYSVGAVLG